MAQRCQHSVTSLQKECPVECEFLQNPGTRNADEGTRHGEEQIIATLKQGEAGLATAELCRHHGITDHTYYRWKAKYDGLDSGEAKKLKQLEDENRKLKHVVADLTLDNQALKDGNWSAP
jgi:putative transposase